MCHCDTLRERQKAERNMTARKDREDGISQAKRRHFTKRRDTSQAESRHFSGEKVKYLDFLSLWLLFICNFY